MQKTFWTPMLLAIALSACSKKEEPQTVAAPEPVPSAEAPAPAPMEAAPMETPAAEAVVPPKTAAPLSQASTQTPLPAPVTEATTPATAPSGSVEGGNKFASTCIGCHGAKGQGIGTFPKLAGLTADVVKSRLTDYRAGKQRGPMSGVMMPIASQLSDADIEALAAHIASLK